MPSETSGKSKASTASSTHSRSAELFERAKNILVGGVNSPVRAFRAVGGTPLVIDRAEGSRLWDVDGREYIDYVCSWGLRFWATRTRMWSARLRIRRVAERATG